MEFSGLFSPTADVFISQYISVIFLFLTSSLEIDCLLAQCFLNNDDFFFLLDRRDRFYFLFNYYM